MKLLSWIVILSFLLIPVNLYSLDAIELITGYMKGNLAQKQDYEGVPLAVSFNFDARSLLEKIRIYTQGRFDFVLEPFINTIMSPDTNVEVGSNFLIKYVFPLNKYLQPYLKGGLGALYMSQHTREQSTQYNFLPQIGAGFHFFIDPKTALSFEYRRRHLSNASFKSPNKGIDTNLLLGGISFFF